MKNLLLSLITICAISFSNSSQAYDLLDSFDTIGTLENHQIGEITPEMKVKYQLTNQEYKELNDQSNRVIINNMLQDIGQILLEDDSKYNQIKISREFWKFNRQALNYQAFSGLRKVAIGPIGDKKEPIGDK